MVNVCQSSGLPVCGPLPCCEAQPVLPNN